MNQYYYDLTDPEARMWQAETAKAYGFMAFAITTTGLKGRNYLKNRFRKFSSIKRPIFPSVYHGRMNLGRENGMAWNQMYSWRRIMEMRRIGVCIFIRF